jgi:hypothetical protein
MKNAGLFFLLPALLLFHACQKEMLSSVGFDTVIEENGSGLTILYLDEDVRTVRLEGIVTLSKGELEVELLDPNGRAVYGETLQGSETLEVDASFDASKGYWKLRYKSLQGVGTMDLHVISD